MITKDDIVAAYRLFLGRDPESSEVVSRLVGEVTTFHQLRQVFLKSAEFSQIIGASHVSSKTTGRPRHPFSLPRIPVEIEAEGEKLVRMFDRIRSEWEKLGDSEPYWSVLTQPEYYQQDFEANRDQFYLSGKYSSDLFFAALRRSGVNPNDLRVCLEVGCGVGRVTGHLAGAVPRILAADISAGHLKIAKAHLERSGITNVELLCWKDPAEMWSLPKVDAVFSVITLQHNPPPIMAWMLQQLLKCLNPGGVAYFQIPSYRNGYLFEVERYLNTAPSETLEMHFLPQIEVFRIIEDQHCRCLEVREDTMVGDEEKMLSNTYLIQKKS